MDELNAPPPLSQSTPELSMNPPIGQILRSAVSSTELLYERAMARFYQAVEIEEERNARKRSFSVDQEVFRRRMSANLEGQEPVLAKLTVLTESERRSSLKRRLSGESPNVLLNIPKLNIQAEKDVVEEKEEEQIPVVPIKPIQATNKAQNDVLIVKESVTDNLPKIEDDDKDEYSSDYTDSTDESINEREKFFTALTNRIENESDTYHPSNMEPRVLSPYRPPTNGNAVEVLTRPLPLVVDPNFVPKPILKKPSMELKTLPIEIPLEDSNSDENSKKKAPDKPERKSLIKTDNEPLISSLVPESIESNNIQIEYQKEPSPMFDKEKTPEIIITETESEIKPEEIEKPIEEIDSASLVNPALIKKKKLQESRQNSIEENKVVAEFYGDIIREIGGKFKKPKIPIYMNPEALKNLNQDSDEEIKEKEEVKPIIKELPKPLYKRPSLPVAIENKLPERPKRVQKSNTLSENDDENVHVDIQAIKNLEINIKPSSMNNLSNQQVPTRYKKERSQLRNRSQSKSPVSFKDDADIANSHSSVSEKSNSPKVTPSSSPLSSRSISPVELEQQEEIKMKTNVKFITDFFLFMIASYMYFFKHPLLALPLLIVIGYRQLRNKN